MSDRSASGGRRPTRPRKKNAATAHASPKVNLSVQDRRHKTRLLNETQRRKDQLLGLTTSDVAVHLHRYTVEPSTVMDESREGESAAKGRRPPSSFSEARTSTTTSAGNMTAPSTHPRGAHPCTTDNSAVAAAPMESDANTRWQTQYAYHLQHKRNAAEQGAAASLRLSDDLTEAMPLPPRSYEEWLTGGCQTGSWAALLEEEVYAPVAAEKALLAAKYDPKGRGLVPQA